MNVRTWLVSSRIEKRFISRSCVSFPIVDYEASNRRAPSPTTVDFDQMPVAQWDARTSSTRSFDPMRSARRCLLRVVPGKGLGFVLSATGDYDHTITSVEKVYSIRKSEQGLHWSSHVVLSGGYCRFTSERCSGRNQRDRCWTGQIRTGQCPWNSPSRNRFTSAVQVVNMLIAAMRREETIDMRVIDIRSRERFNNPRLDLYQAFNANSNNNNNNSISTAMRSSGTTVRSDENLSDIHGSLSTSDGIHRNKMTSTYPNSHDHSRHSQNISNRSLNPKTFGLSTGSNEDHFHLQ